MQCSTSGPNEADKYSKTFLCPPVFFLTRKSPDVDQIGEKTAVGRKASLSIVVGYNQLSVTTLSNRIEN